MFDIDNFKRVNDTYGHQLGDDVIQRVAQATKSVLRASDILGRIGGDEFGVLLVNTNSNVTDKIAEKIRRKIECLEMNADEETPVYITVSVGAAKYRFGSDTVEELIARADQALYQAKEQGRNRVVALW
jgi:diguanylate cyclase (GGDEF)-like protein